jgi:hypothetical protein
MLPCRKTLDGTPDSDKAINGDDAIFVSSLDEDRHGPWR